MRISTEPIARDVTFQVPVTERLKIGSMPRDYFDQNPDAVSPFVPCENGACENLPQGVWREQTLLDGGGEPQMRTVTRYFEATPANPVWASFTWGAVGGVVGAVVGGLVGALIGNVGAGALVLGVAGAGLSGYVAAEEAAKDRVALVWDDNPIVHHTMEGYHERVARGSLGGERGFYHRHLPQVDSAILGTYQTPRVVHYREGEEPK